MVSSPRFGRILSRRSVLAGAGAAAGALLVAAGGGIMALVPSSKNRRRVEIPAGQYDWLKQIADAEERTVTSVLAELLGSALRNYRPPSPPSEPPDRYTPRAARVLALAREQEPPRFNHNYVGTEHLLLALVDEGEGLAARVLRGFGVESDKVRSEVEFIIGRGAEPARGPVDYTPRVRRVLALAADEARKLDHNFIGTGHLLLGLVREGEGIAAGILASLGVLDKLRDTVLQAFARREMPLSES